MRSANRDGPRFGSYTPTNALSLINNTDVSQGVHTLRISSRSSLKPSAIDAIQNLRNFSFRACSLSGAFGAMKGGISTLGGGEGESRCTRRGSGCPGLGLLDGADMSTPSSSEFESSCDSSDEEAVSSSLSSVSSLSGGFDCRTVTVTVFLGVDASDEDDEEESSSEDDESETTLLFRFLFLFLAGFGCPGPICKVEV